MLLLQAPGRAAVELQLLEGRVPVMSSMCPALLVCAEGEGAGVCSVSANEEMRGDPGNPAHHRD